MPIAITNGMNDQASSSGIDPWIGAPTCVPVWSWYLMAKIATKITTAIAKNDVTPRIRKYSLSTSAANVDACGGKIGMEDNIRPTRDPPLACAFRDAASAG